MKRDFSDIVLPEQLHSNVRLLASSAANTKKHGAPFRHMLFYGEGRCSFFLAIPELSRRKTLAMNRGMESLLKCTRRKHSLNNYP